MSSKTPEGKKKYAPRRPFPLNSLEEALKVAAAIQDKNAGKPWKPFLVAEALGIKATSSNFRDIASSAFKYGLTDGTWSADYIGLTALGKTITKPPNPQQEVKDTQAAVLNIDVFKKIYEHYKDAKLPAADTYFKNMLETEFGVPPELADDCIQLVLDNGRFAKIIRDSQGAAYVVFAETPPELPPEAPGDGVEGIEPQEPIVQTPSIPPISPVPPVTPPKKVEIKPTVFISHSKNALIVDQLKTILEFGQFDYKIAEETETTAIPIPERVFGSMRECDCAIINVSADEQEKKPDGTFNVNPNVLTEIGGAFLLYERKVILLVDKRVQLPSNLQGLYRCEYEGDELAFSTYLKLQKALAEFRKS